MLPTSINYIAVSTDLFCYFYLSVVLSVYIFLSVYFLFLSLIILARLY